MNKYLVFAGAQYYPAEGFENLVGTWPTIEEAIAGFLKICEDEYAEYVKEFNDPERARLRHPDSVLRTREHRGDYHDWVQFANLETREHITEYVGRLGLFQKLDFTKIRQL